MSLNWVMLSPSKGFTPLPGEQRLYTSPPRTALSLQTLNKFPGKQPFSVQSSSGCVYLTNRRIVYLPHTSSPTLQSFAAPILNLHDTHVTAPFFGPNVWAAVVQPVPGGNIPAEHAALELKLTFKDGGAFDFHSIFERSKERLQQAVDVARESGQLLGAGVANGGDALSGVNYDSVHLDELPAYEDATSPAGIATARIIPAENSQFSPLIDLQEDVPEPLQVQSVPQASRSETFVPPSEPPPEYETVQTLSVAEELDRRTRNPTTS